MKSKCIPSPRRAENTLPNSRKGSVLLVTILVVSLLLVIVLGLVTFVRLELRRVQAHHHVKQAQSTAKLGMNMALARLQDLTGPDQRITARSDLFDDDTHPNTYTATSARPEKSKWVGVWDAESFNETDPTEKLFLGWLVSGDPADVNVEQVNAVQTAFPNPGALITLVGGGTVAQSSDAVRVPKVPAGNGLNYAWWVKDENIAARFDTSDPYRNSADPVKRQFSLHSAQRYGVEMMNVEDSSLLGDTLFPYEHPVFTLLLKRLASLNQAPLIWQSSPGNMSIYQTLIRNRYHDLSLVSRGLLVDVRNGGLRKDLNMAFEMPYDAWETSDFVDEHPHAEIPLYQPPGYPGNRKIAPIIRITDFSAYGFTPESGKGPFQMPPVPYDNPASAVLRANNSSRIAPVLRGPSWDLFRNFYRLYKTNDPDLAEYGLPTNMNVQADGSLRGRSPFPSAHGYGRARRFGQEPLVWDYVNSYGPNGSNYSVSLPLGRPVLPGISPVVTRLQNVVSFRTVAIPNTTPTQYQLDMYLEPIITLWNPYNVRLKTGRSYSQPLVLSVRFLNLRPWVEARVPGVDPTPDVTRTMSTSFSNLLDQYAEPGSEYFEQQDQTFQIEIDPGAYIMEPGEVLVFSHAGPAVAYWRDEGMNPNDPGYSRSGVSIVLSPGVDNLRGDSGLKLENVVRHLSNNGLFPGGFMTADVELRFRLESGQGSKKFKVEGVSADGKEPFMDSFQAAAEQITTDWTVDAHRVSSLSALKLPTVFFDAYLKHADSPDPINMVSQFNLRAQTYEQGTDFGIQSSAYRAKVEDAFWGDGKVVNHLNGLISMDGNNGFWGPTNESAGIGDWNTNIPLFDIPRAPMTSLGNFQHVPISLMADEPSYIVGNSTASIFVGYSPISLQPLANVLSGGGNLPSRSERTMTRADWSYLLNQALFDSYFFSGIAPTSGYTTSKAQLEDHIEHKTPLHNSPYRFRAANGGDANDIMNRLFDAGGDPTQNAPGEMAAHLWVDGMFNINSTSVDAWKALLASTRKIKVETQEDGEIVSSGTAYTRMSIPYRGENEEWTGFRSLSDEQIESLAEEIVIQVKERGPFLNLADFVNRRAAAEADPSPVHPHMKMGALEAAIQASGINNAYYTETLGEKGLSSGKSELNNWVRDRVERDSKIAEGVTGYATQADLLSVIAPLLSARSDTFTIRSYGEFEDQAGNVISRAWCEAVVQRVPDYQDSSKPSGESSDLQPYELPLTTDSYDTHTLRRKYEIIRFRWLVPEEI